VTESPTRTPRVWHPITLGMTLRTDGLDYVAFRLKFALRVPEGHIITGDYRGLGPFRWLLAVPLIAIRRRGVAGWWAAVRYAVNVARHGWPPVEDLAWPPMGDLA
jgi:hypothetical protein